MAYSVESKTQNPANQLREALDKAERLVVVVDSSTIEEFLLLLDHIDASFDSIGETALDIRPEEVRWQSLLNRIRSRPTSIVGAARHAGGMDALRAKHPPAEGFWWWLDAEVARRRIAALRRSVISVVSLAAVLAALYFGINYFFPPNPDTVLLVETTGRLDRFVFEQDWEGGLALVRQTRAQLPDEPELMIWEAVLLERLGENEQAESVLAEAAQALDATPSIFWIQLGNTRLQVGDMDGAEAAGNEALALNPDDPQAHFLLGGVEELRGNFPQAIAYFERTAELAEESNAQLSVIAKVRMGQLMQRPVEFPGAESPLDATDEATGEATGEASGEATDDVTPTPAP